MKKYLSIMSRKTKVKCFGVILLAFLSSLLASIWPVKLGELYTNISDGTISSLTAGATAVITFGVIYLLSECIAIIRRVILDCVIAGHESEVRNNSVGKLLKMPLSYYSGCLTGEKTAQLNQGVSGFSQLIKTICNDVFTTILTAICTLVQVFLNAPTLIVGIMLLYLTITVFISMLQIKSQNGIRENIVNQKNALDGQICQSITNLEMIRSMNAEEYEKKRLFPSIVNICHTEKKHHRYMGSFDCIKQLCKILFQVTILIVSILLISEGKMSAGSIITVCLLFQQLIKPIDEVYRFMDETASSVIKAKTLIEVLSAPSDEIFTIQPTNNNVSEDFIRIENVVITNPEKDQALAFFDKIVIPSGTTIAIQGPNGCGKSSLIRCLNRYYPHVQGQIHLFGNKQESIDQKQLTKMLYYSPQSSFFISGTIRENLLYGIEREVCDDELISALQKVHLIGFEHNDTVIDIDSKKALDYCISEKADELSGGMKQRLSLARAFLRKPKLFIFDEITANLDTNATEYVLSSIESYAKSIKAGIVYISHDENIVKRCDKVINLDNKLLTAPKAA